MQSATWAVDTASGPVLTSVTFFAPEQVLAARRQQAMEEVFSAEGQGVSGAPLDETPEMKRLREKAEAAPSAEEAEHYIEQYQKLAAQRLAYHSS